MHSNWGQLDAARGTDGGHNKCRDPGAPGSGSIWCYTMDPNTPGDGNEDCSAKTVIATYQKVNWCKLVAKSYTHADILFEFNGASLDIGEHTDFFTDTSDAACASNKVCTAYDKATCSIAATHVTAVASGTTFKMKADKNVPPGYTEEFCISC